MTHRRVIAAALVHALLAPASARAEPPVARAGAVRLDVDVSALPDDRFTKALRANLLESHKATLEREGIAVDDGAGEVLRIEIGRYGPNDIHYRVTLEIVGDEGSTRELTCEACTDAQLLEKVEAETAVLAERLARDDAPSEPAAEPPLEVARTPAAADPETAEGDPRSAEPAIIAPQDPENRDSAPLGTMGKAGIGLLSGGAVAVVSGGIAFAVGERVDPAVGLMRDRGGLDYGPAGVALMVSGGAALVTGAALLAVDRTRARKRASVLLLPSPGGAVITGRF